MGYNTQHSQIAYHYVQSFGSWTRIIIHPDAIIGRSRNEQAALPPAILIERQNVTCTTCFVKGRFQTNPGHIGPDTFLRYKPQQGERIMHSKIQSFTPGAYNSRRDTSLDLCGS